jgi:hypothetical protein
LRLDHSELQNLRVFLLGTHDAHGLYEQFGFRPLARPELWMSIHDPDSDKRATLTSAWSGAMHAIVDVIDHG